MHPLDGPRAKVKRAKAQLIALQEDSQRFFAKNPLIAVTQFDKKAGNYAIRVKECPSGLPEQWSVIVGEIAHDLRSALDLLAWQLALLQPATPYDWTAFPIHSIGRSRRKKTRSFWGKQEKGPPCLESIHRRYWARIEAFQPYKGGHGYLRSPLFLLHELNNADKHRLIQILSASVGSYQITGLFGADSKIKPGVTIRPNAKIGWINPLPFPVPTLDFEDGRPRIKMQEEVQVKFDVSSSIRFGDGCDAAKNLPIFRTLDNISSEVSRIIESFASDF